MQAPWAAWQVHQTGTAISAGTSNASSSREPSRGEPEPKDTVCHAGGATPGDPRQMDLEERGALKTKRISCYTSKDCVTGTEWGNKQIDWCKSLTATCQRSPMKTVHM